MELIKKYTALQLKTDTINKTVSAKLEYGNIEGPYYSLEHPEEEFDTEQDAIDYAYKTNMYAKWLIVPIIKFSMFENE